MNTKSQKNLVTNQFLFYFLKESEEDNEGEGENEEGTLDFGDVDVESTEPTRWCALQMEVLINTSINFNIFRCNQKAKNNICFFSFSVYQPFAFVNRFSKNFIIHF